MPSIYKSGVVAYSFNPESKDVVDVVVGRRNKRNLNFIISTLIHSKAKKITTDKLDIYKSIIPKEVHSTKYRGINRIERNNLNLRTHLKRLNRRSLCFSKSLAVLNSAQNGLIFVLLLIELQEILNFSVFLKRMLKLNV
jgi:insertion element IS1 protein InsB